MFHQISVVQQVRQPKKLGSGIPTRLIAWALICLSTSLWCSEKAFSRVKQDSDESKAKQVSTNILGFGIPFEIDESDPSVVEIQLYLSVDRGETWRFYSRRRPDQKSFPFQAEGEGEYWFALKTLNRDRKLLPEGSVKPQLIIKVDLEKPELDFRVETDQAGRVVCRWRAYDKNLNTKSLRIDYQPVRPDASNWSQVPVQLNGTVRNGLYSDQLAWWPNSDEPSLLVRMSIADDAGNLIQAERQVVVPVAPWKFKKSSTAFPSSSGSISSETSRRNFQPAAPVIPEASPDKLAQKPAGVICKDGVCYRADSDASVTAASKSPDIVPVNSTAHSPFQLASSRKVIGGPPEYADPPVPDDLTSGQTENQGMRVAKRLPNEQVSTSRQSGSVWKSNSERWIPEHQQSSASTLYDRTKPISNPYAKPQREAKSKLSNQTKPNLPAPNPSKMKTIGNQVVSESSTMFPANQYRGPKVIAGVNETAEARLMPNYKSQTASNNATNENPSVDPSSTNGPTNNIAERGKPSPRQRADQFKKASFQDGRQSVIVGNSMANLPEESATQTIGSRRFRLNYGIDAIDPSGVAQVDLWITTDGGGSWKTWGKDTDNASPFPVEVTGEGLYGFRIVVHSKDGLTGRGPSSGDKPDIWVQVDTTSPLARITSVPYGRGVEAGRLVITYSVQDDHLVLRPITLSYSERQNGPWIAIEDGLRNEGRYLWKPDSNVPDRIYLRLDARDRAGNMGVHILNQPIDVSGLVPRGTIHGVTPIGN